MSTRLDLRNDAKARADHDNSDFPTEAQYNRFLDLAAKRVFANLLMSGWPVDTATTTIVANGSTTYAFGGADTVWGVTSVTTNIGGDFYELKRVNPGDVHLLNSQGASGAPSQFYEVRMNFTTGPVIEFYPRAASGSYIVGYIIAFPGFANDAAIWRGPDRSDELIAIDAARRGCLKEGSARIADARELEREYKDLMDEVKQGASWFDMRNPPQIRRAVRNDAAGSFDYRVRPINDFDW